MSLAHNTEIVVQILPYLNSLSELPAPLKRYEPQIRFAVDALKWDNRVLMIVAVTLQHACEFQQWHQKHVAERNARDQFLAAQGITPKNYIGLPTPVVSGFRANAPPAAHREDSCDRLARNMMAGCALVSGNAVTTSPSERLAFP